MINENDAGIINNRYRIIRTLGQGGMGIVYLVEDALKDNLPFALKTIKQGVLIRPDSTGVLNFKNEYEIMTRLKHPNLTQVYDFGEDSDNYFIVMEYLEGILLSDYIREQGRVEGSIDIIVQILRALEYMHSRNIIYRDIKPRNIMLVNGSVKLMDFGLSAFKDKKEDVIRGTVLYLPPDAISGNSGFFLDIFSLGAVFFELITGVQFYMKGRPDTKMIMKVLRKKEEFESFQKERLELVKDQGLRNIIAVMTAYDKSDRYQTCSEVIEAINRDVGADYEYETAGTKESYVLGNAFANRSEELGLLKSLLNAEKKPSMLVYNGALGVGKTRLFAEFKKYCRLNEMLFFEASCVDGDIRPYYSIGDILMQMVTHASLRIMGRYGPYLKHVLPEYDNLRGYDRVEAGDDPSTVKDIIIQNSSDFIIEFCRGYRSPVILYFNDLHWVDEGSGEVIKALIHKLSLSGLKGIPLLIYASMNEDRIRNSHVAELVSLKDVMRADMMPLNSEAVHEYIENVFGNSFTDMSIKNSISGIKERVGGNPLFLEELIKSLIERNIIIKDGRYWRLTKKIEDADIPDNLMDIMRARVERLLSDKDRRSILKILSLLRIDLAVDGIKYIISRIYTIDVASVLLDLEKSEIIQSMDIGGRFFYGFNSTLTKKLIRESISNRNEISLFLAETLESIYEESADFAEEIAYHYMEGGNILKAEAYYEKCGDISQGLYYNEKAIKYYDTALNLSKNAGFIIRVSIKKAISLEITGRLDLAVSVLEDLIKPAEESGNKLDLARIYSLKGKYLLTRGDITSASKDFEISCRIAEEEGNESLARDALLNLGDFYFAQAEYKQAIEYFEKCRELCEKHGFKREYFHVMNSLGSTYYMLSSFERALECYRTAIAAAEEIGDKRRYANAVGNMGNVYKHQTRYEKALECFKTHRRMSEEMGDKRGVGIAAGNMGIIYKVRGEFEKALECYELYRKMSEEIGFKRGIGIAVGNMGNVYNGQYKYDKAMECFKEQKKIAGEINDKRQLAVATANMGSLHFNRGDFNRAIQCFTIFSRISEETGDKMGRGIALEALGNIYYRMDDHGRSFEYIERAIALFTELEIYDTYYIDCLLGKSRILLARGDRKGAHEINTEAMRLSETLEISAYIFNCRIQDVRIRAHKDRISGVKTLKEMLREDLSEDQRAEIYYELCMLESNEEYTKKAVKMFREIYGRHPNFLYRQRAEKILSLHSRNKENEQT